MRNRINSDKQNQCFETCRSYESAEEEKGKSPHFITKVTDVKWNIDGASYAVCHYNGNLPTHEGMGVCALETRLLYHFVYKPNLMIL